MLQIQQKTRSSADCSYRSQRNKDEVVIQGIIQLPESSTPLKTSDISHVQAISLVGRPDRRTKILFLNLYPHLNETGHDLKTVTCDPIARIGHNFEMCHPLVSPSLSLHDV